MASVDEENNVANVKQATVDVENGADGELTAPKVPLTAFFLWVFYGQCGNFCS